MSAIFEQASIWNPYDVVKIEQRTPRRYDTSGRLLALDNLHNEDGFGHDEKLGSSDEKAATTGVAQDTRDASSTGSDH